MALPTTMRAGIIRHLGETIEIADVPMPTVESMQILVKIEFSGVCHTDVHVCKGDWLVKAHTPLITGHEGVGTVVSMGAGCPKKGHIVVGDRVGIPWLNGTCGRCDDCLAGRENVCLDMSPVGFNVNGCHAEYVAVNLASVVKIPARLQLDQAAPILCAGVTSYKAVKVSKVRAGQWLAIFGAAGGLGHLAVQYAHAMGIKVCAIDKGRDRLEDLVKLGANSVIDANDDNVVSAVRSVCAHNGPHGAIVFSPDLDTYPSALATIRANGTVVAVSLPQGEFSVNAFDLVVHGKKLVGSIVGTRLDLIEALRLARDGHVTCTIHERSLDDLPEVFEDLEAQQIKGRVVIRF